jgi:hypothetical protein
MRYFSVYTHKPTEGMPTPEHMAAMNKLVEEGHREGWLVITEGIAFGEVGFRVHADGQKVTVTDGPFAEAKEVIGGYAILEVKSREEALALTRKFLAVTGEGTCELHQLFEMGPGHV